MPETFPMPSGFIPPENLDSDNTFQAMATFKLVSDSELQLVDIEGYQVGEEDTEGDTEAAQQAEQANAASALQSVANAAGGPPGAGAPGAGALQGAGAAGGAERNMSAPAGTQANMPPPTFGEQMKQRFRAVTGRR